MATQEQTQCCGASAAAKALALTVLCGTVTVDYSLTGVTTGRAGTDRAGRNG